MFARPDYQRRIIREIFDRPQTAADNDAVQHVAARSRINIAAVRSLILANLLPLFLKWLNTLAADSDSKSKSEPELQRLQLQLEVGIPSRTSSARTYRTYLPRKINVILNYETSYATN